MTVDSIANVQLHPSWLQHLSAEFEKPYFTALNAFLVEERAKHQVFPPGSLI
jgi:uracil-DNA glycosylase